MKESVVRKLEHLVERFEEVQALLGDPGVIGDQDKFRNLSKEFSQLEDVVAGFNAYQQAQENLASAQEMLNEDDAEMREMAQEEMKDAKAEIERLETELQVLLLPKDPNDDNNCFLEIRAGAGGDEAAIFAGDLFRMYSRYAESRGWRVELVNANEGEHGGYKEVIANVSGDGVYGVLKFESGGHRVQRVPETESGGRVHTSAATVAVLPEAEDVDIQINANDLRIDTMRSSGAGGQHVNTTDSAVRITHLPTGIVVTSSEKSQHRNREIAMQVLKTRLYDLERQRVDDERSADRKSQVGSGDRSERIRTYNFPQGRMSDHRINLTLYKLDQVMQGDLDEMIDALTADAQASMLADLNQ